MTDYPDSLWTDPVERTPEVLHVTAAFDAEGGATIHVSRGEAVDDLETDDAVNRLAEAILSLDELRQVQLLVREKMIESG
jgi:hypothetical protein